MRDMVHPCETKDAVNDEVAADGIGLSNGRYIDFCIACAVATLAQTDAAGLTEREAAGDVGPHVRELTPDLVLRAAVTVDLPVKIVAVEDLRRRVEEVIGHSGPI